MVCAQGSCPLSYFSFDASGIQPFTISYPDAARETLLTAGQGFCRAGYDLVSGSVRASSGTGGAYAHSEAGIRDDFTVSGLAPGTPFTIQVRLTLTAQVQRDCSTHGNCGSADGRATLREEPANEATYFAPVSANASIHVTIHGTAGVPFQIFASVGTRTSATAGIYGGFASVIGLLDFVDLPVGSRIVSCKGYLQDPVAISRTSWGRLKQGYR
jgi:hypothetical protein